MQSGISGKGKPEKRDKDAASFLACGTEDALVENNRRFRNFLQEQGEEVVYHESAGIHDWKFWNEYLEPAIIWVLDRGSREKGKKNE